MMTVEYSLAVPRSQPKPLTAVSVQGPSGIPAKLARMVALAHRLEGLVRSGAVANYRELARREQVSPARLSQILTLLHLAPAIQEYILCLSPGEGGFIAEAQIQRLLVSLGGPSAYPFRQAHEQEL